ETAGRFRRRRPDPRTSECRRSSRGFVDGVVGGDTAVLRYPTTPSHSAGQGAVVETEELSCQAPFEAHAVGSQLPARPIFLRRLRSGGPDPPSCEATGKIIRRLICQPDDSACPP